MERFFRYKDMNFIKVSRNIEKKVEKKKIIFVLPLLILFILVAVYGGLEYAGRKYLIESDAIKKSIEGMRRSISVEETEAEVRMMEAYCLNASNVSRCIDSYGMIKEEEIQRATELGEGKVSIVSLEYRLGHLILGVQTADYREASLYLERLRESEIFLNITYNGFQKQQQGYYFLIDCLENTQSEEGLSGDD